MSFLRNLAKAAGAIITPINPLLGAGLTAIGRSGSNGRKVVQELASNYPASAPVQAAARYGLAADAALTPVLQNYAQYRYNTSDYGVRQQAAVDRVDREYQRMMEEADRRQREATNRVRELEDRLANMQSQVQDYTQPQQNSTPMIWSGPRRPGRRY